jgi:hypothetical protein
MSTSNPVDQSASGTSRTPAESAMKQTSKTDAEREDHSTPASDENAQLPLPVANGLGDQSFEYEGILFTLSVNRISDTLFLPLARYHSGLPEVESIALPQDTEPYGSEAEAWRHAEQQAVRWVHDRTGDGRGRF